MKFFFPQAFFLNYKFVVDYALLLLRIMLVEHVIVLDENVYCYGTEKLVTEKSYSYMLIHCIRDIIFRMQLQVTVTLSLVMNCTKFRCTLSQNFL